MEGINWLTGKQVMRQVRRHTETALLINKKQEVCRANTRICWQQLYAQGRRPHLPRVQEGFIHYALHCPQTSGRKLLACCGSVPRHRDPGQTVDNIKYWWQLSSIVQEKPNALRSVSTAWLPTGCQPESVTVNGNGGIHTRVHEEFSQLCYT